MSRSSKFPMISMEEAFAKLHTACLGFMAKRSTTCVVSQHQDWWLSPQRVADTITAPIAVPVVPCSRLDGYAVRGAVHQGAEMRVIGRRHAGSEAVVKSEGAAAGAGDETVWVTTGAPIPAGFDTIVPVENTALVQGGSGASTASEEVIRITQGVPAGNGVRPAGSDIAAGEVLLSKGDVIGPGEAATLLSAGVTSAPVERRELRVLVISTGDEVLDAADVASASSSSAATAAAIDTNRPLLISLIKSTMPGVVVDDGGIVRDDKALLQEKLRSACLTHDVIITTGGVSIGDRDFVKPLLDDALGLKDTNEATSTIHFGRLAMKPGKPAMAATVTHAASGKDTLFFGLPGNPVSAWVCAQLLVVPALRCLASGDSNKGSWPSFIPTLVEGVRLLDGVVSDPERDEYQRAVVFSAKGALYARMLSGAQASSRIASITKCNALLLVPKGKGIIQPSAAGDSACLSAYMIGPLANPAQVFGASSAAAEGDLADPSFLRPIPQGIASSAHTGGCGCGRDHGPGAADHLAPSSTPADAPTSATAAGSSDTGKVHPPHALAPASKLHVPFAVITFSDRAFTGEVEDKTGPFIVDYLSTDAGPFHASPSVGLHPMAPSDGYKAFIHPDGDRNAVSRILSWLLDYTAKGKQWPRLIVTTGGTGMGPRDCTPELLRPLISRPCPGLQHAMLQAGLAATPMAALSRYECGIIDAEVVVDRAGKTLTAASLQVRHDDIAESAAEFVDDPDFVFAKQVEKITGTTPATRNRYVSSFDAMDQVHEWEDAAKQAQGRHCLLIQVPGSVKAARESLDAIARVLPHALALISE